MIPYWKEKSLFALLGESLRRVDWNANLNIYDNAEAEIRELLPSDRVDAWISFFFGQLDDAVRALPRRISLLSGKVPMCEHEEIRDAFAQMASDPSDASHAHILARLTRDAPLPLWRKRSKQSSDDNTVIPTKRQRPLQSFKSKATSHAAKANDEEGVPDSESHTTDADDGDDEDGAPPSDDSALREPITIGRFARERAGDPFALLRRPRETAAVIGIGSSLNSQPLASDPIDPSICTATLPQEPSLPVPSQTQHLVAPFRQPISSSSPSSMDTSHQETSALPTATRCASTTPQVGRSASAPPVESALGGGDLLQSPRSQCGAMVRPPLTPCPDAAPHPTSDTSASISTLHALASEAVGRIPASSGSLIRDSSAPSSLAQARDQAWKRRVPIEPPSQKQEDWIFSRIYSMKSIPVLNYFDAQAYRWIPAKNESFVRLVKWQCRCCKSEYEPPDGITGNLVTHLYYCPRRLDPASKGLPALDRVRPSHRGRQQVERIETPSPSMPSMTSTPNSASTPTVSETPVEEHSHSSPQPLSQAEKAVLASLLRRIGIDSITSVP
ncbi:hypothetical protein CF319_g2267 [Tilletia indica]|nr:hypothetical protein CF319_g2267 [Tilletia indica]